MFCFVFAVLCYHVLTMFQIVAPQVLVRAYLSRPQRAIWAAMVASSESKRHRFVVRVRPPQRRVKVPEAKDVVLGPRPVAPPTEVAAKLRASPLVIGVDIETHDLLGRHMKWWTGPLGFATLADPFTIQEARIVQIGWCVHARKGLYNTGRESGAEKAEKDQTIPS